MFSKIEKGVFPEDIKMSFMEEAGRFGRWGWKKLRNRPLSLSKGEVDPGKSSREG